jgi:SIR2-like protein
MAQPPYGIILDKLNEGKVVPFLGAGASIVGREVDSKWNPKDLKFLPNSRELSRYLARKSQFPSDDDRDLNDLSKVASYYAAVSGRQTLREELHKLLGREFTFGLLHEYLASIATPLLIITTNYDTLLEQAFQVVGKKYDVVIHPTDRQDIKGSVWWWPYGATQPEAISPRELDLDLEGEKRNTVIYKMHGSVKHDASDLDSFVITEEDYVDFLSRMRSNTAIPTMIYQYLRTRSFLFLGYGLGDWNLRVILKDLDNYLKGERRDEANADVPSWAIQRSPSELERTLWEKRNVKIYDMIHDDFVANMKAEAEGY